MPGEEHYGSHKCEFMLPKNTKITAYSVNTDLCPTEMDQNLVTKSCPTFEETIMHDVMKNTCNGTANILIGVDNYWKLEPTNILPHDSHRFVAMKSKYGWTLAVNLSKNGKLMGKNMGHYKISVNLSKTSILETLLEISLIETRKWKINRNTPTRRSTQLACFKKQLNNYLMAVCSKSLIQKEAFKLKDNYFLALIRFNSLRKSLKRHRERFYLYHTALKDILEDKAIKEVVEKPELLNYFILLLLHSPFSRHQTK